MLKLFTRTSFLAIFDTGRITTFAQLLQMDVILAHKKEYAGKTSPSNARLNSSEDGDGSLMSNTSSNPTLNENDPLLTFLRSQHTCIKGKY